MRRALPGRVSLCVLLQTDINENMRAILIDWLVEVHYKFKVSAMKEHSSGSAVPRLHCMLSSASLIKFATPVPLCLQASRAWKPLRRELQAQHGLRWCL